jgi:hypothetical protein
MTAVQGAGGNTMSAPLHPLKTNLAVQFDQLDNLSKVKLEKIYMAFLGTCSCIVSRKKPIQRHHVRKYGNSGTACKPPDIYCVPLHHEYHTGDKGIHTLGEKTFCTRYDIDFDAEITRLHTMFEKYYGRLTDAERK